MTRLGSPFTDMLRGNADWEAFSFPTFYLGCRARFASMQPGDIARYQTQKARNIVRYALRHAPFFHELYQGHDPADVWSLPTVDKRTMTANLTEYNTLGLRRDEILDFCLRVERTRDFSLRLKGVNIGMSSGTSANKGVEINTQREEGYLRAAFLVRFPYIGHRLAQDVAAYHPLRAERRRHGQPAGLSVWMLVPRDRADPGTVGRRLYITARERIAQAAREGIRQVFASYGCHEPSVEVEFAVPEPNPRSHKLIRVHRAFDVDI
jgi:hypothetical protein